MSGTFAPAPGRAPFAARVAAHAAIEARLLLRNGEQLLLALVIPVVALLGGLLVSGRVGLPAPGAAVDVLTPGVLALAVLSTGFTSLAITTGFERRSGVLKRLGASPLTRGGLLAGKVGALLIVQTVQALVVGAVALACGWSPAGGVGIGLALVVALLGTAAFGGLGLALAGTLRAEATLAAANLVYLLLLTGGAVLVPRSSYGAAAPVLALLPSAALGDGMRAALLDGRADGPALLVLTGWAVLGTALASRFFRWE